MPLPSPSNRNRRASLNKIAAITQKVYRNMNNKTARELLNEMQTLQTALRSEPVTLFVCKCCQQVAHSVSQPSLVAGSEPIIQVECLDTNCKNYMQTMSYRPSDPKAYAQAVSRYLPVTMAADRVAYFMEAAS